MPVRNLTALLIAVIATIAVSRSADAQEYPPGTWGRPDGILEMQTDWRWFETAYNADIEELDPKHRANCGWYAACDRAYLMVNRPETEQSYNKGDFGWGTRIEWGYMGQEDRGWALTYWNLGGPNVYETDLQSRANVLNTEDPYLPGVDPTPGMEDFRGQLLPAHYRNNEMFLERIYEVRDSLNVVSMKGIELNRTWRLESYRRGGILEPMIGLRYIDFNDTNRDDEYAVGPGERLDATGTIVQELQETFTQQVDANDNQLYGGQIGFRYFKFQNRFTHSLDLRAFAFQNFQCNTFSTSTTQTFYGADLPGEVDDPVLFEDSNSTYVYHHGDEFVFGFDLRAQSSLQLTRDINLRAGVQVMDFARGILRGPVRGGKGDSHLSSTTAVTDQNVWIVGYTFGLTLNR